MIVFEKWKITLITIVVLASAILASPNIISGDGNKAPLGLSQINLGLDLQGGSYLLLKVELDDVIEERLSNSIEAIRSEMRSSKIGVKNLNSDQTSLSFDLRNENDRSKALEILNQIIGNDLEITNTGSGFSASYSELGLEEISRLTVEQAIEIVRNRIDETGTKEPIIQRQGTDRILIQLPGVDNPEDVKRLLGKTARLGFQMVDITTTALEAQNAGRIPPGSEILEAADDSGELYLVRKRVLISGDMLDDARPAFGQNNEPVVSFQLNATGGARFGRVTGQNIGRPFAIVLDGKVVSAPVIRAQIFTEGQISGSFSVEESNELALLLRAGALPAPLSVLEERSVGPGLGSDSIEAGKVASIIGLIAVVAFMIASYGTFGVIAVIALSINIILIIAALSTLGATLTLPGIAGIVLTIGMAVDANVLIFERIREELERGRKVVSSINAGFKQATATIVDANLTTLAAATFLYFLGSGPIKGFSVTLSIGVLTSMFTATMVTRMLVVLWINYKRPKTLAI